MHMNIIVFSPTAHGGHPAYVREVVSAIKEINNNINIGVMTRTDLDAEFDSDTYNIYKILPKLINKNKFRFKLYWFLNRFFIYLHQDIILIKYCVEKKVNAVHFQEFTPIFSILTIFILKFLLRIKIYITIHNVKPHTYPKYVPKKIIDFFMACRISLSDSVFVHTVELKEMAISLCNGRWRDKILVAPHGVWTYYNLIDRSYVYSRNGLFFFGTLRHNKGIEILLHSLILLMSKGCHINTIIIGKSDDDNFCKKSIIPLVNKLRTNGYPLIFEDKFATTDEIVKYADVSQYLVLPYIDFSAQSGVLFDALALDLPLITTPGHSVSDFVNRYQIGAVAQTASPEDLATVIEDEIVNYKHKKYEKIIQNLKKSHTWSEHARIVTTVYNE